MLKKESMSSAVIVIFCRKENVNITLLYSKLTYLLIVTIIVAILDVMAIVNINKYATKNPTLCPSVRKIIFLSSMNTFG